MLRRFYIEKVHWKDYQKWFIRDKVRTPPELKRDTQRQEEIAQEKKLQLIKANKVILPKINKKAQIKQRIMNWQHDTNVMDRKLEYYKNIKVTEKDPFALFTHLSKAAQAATDYETAPPQDEMHIEEDYENEDKEVSSVNATPTKRKEMVGLDGHVTDYS